MKWIWFAIGWISVGIGFIGIIIPGLPTTIFMVFAAWCFSKSSPRFERWILELPGVGQLVSDYRDGLGMPRRAKISALVMIVAAVTLSSFMLDRWAIRLVVIVAGVIGLYWVAIRVPTREGPSPYDE